MNDILYHVYFGNTVRDWLIAAGLIVVTFILLALFKRILLKRVRSWTSRTKNSYDDFIVFTVEKYLLPFLYLGSFYLAFSYLTLPLKATKIIDVALLVVATFFVLRIITAGVRFFIYSFIKKHNDNEGKQKQARGLIIVLNIIVWMIGIVFLLDNLGYDVATIIAGMGIGGIAIALAAQTILGDLFSYFVIFFDRPFEIGDFIVLDEKQGTVEYVGVKTTRIRTLSGEQLILSNKDLTDSRIHNYKRMEKRRVVFKLGVTYQTPSHKLEQIPGIVKQCIVAQTDVTFDRAHFSGFGSSSLDFEFVYYVEVADYNYYMDKQQAIYLDIFKAFEKEKIDFAYPTQTLYLNREHKEELDHQMN